VAPPCASAQSYRPADQSRSASRECPRDFIETGITTLDLMNSLVRGQKLPLVLRGGCRTIASRWTSRTHARLDARGERMSFAIVFAGIGVPVRQRGVLSAAASSRAERSSAPRCFLNLASDSSTQRLLTPRFALTAAEYLAFTCGKHVLVILTDMTNYAEALREVSSSKGEIPSRKASRLHVFDLAMLFERAGCLRERPGTLTQLSDPDDARGRHRVIRYRI
jgi:V/A-type H+-transporting ATPase subunit B